MCRSGWSSWCWHCAGCPRRRAARLDLPGAVTATAGVAALVYGFISAASDGWGAPGTDISLAVGAALLVAFVAIELCAPQPLLPLHLFADRNRAAAYVNMFLGPAAGMSMFSSSPSICRTCAG
ncbi:hypothetical protein ACIGO9_33585 [Nocardia asteroides]|uniref:hypothetical protein n=1 Tax=Nocardia asteroides TaxID=1824 RepID=UPI0037C6FD70